LLALTVVGSILVLASLRGMPADEVRALTFFSLVTTMVALIFLNRSFSASLISALRRPNLALTFVLAWIAAVLGLTLFWPFASELFRFGPLHGDDLALTLGAGALALASLELLKPLSRRRAAR
jgi:Ca2+-transporting ATPase